MFASITYGKANNSFENAWGNFKKDYKETASWAYGENKIFLDVKIRFAELTTLTPAKNGTALLLTQTSDLGMRETREDYSLWLKNYKSHQKKRRVYIEYDIELRSPAMVREGRLLASKRLRVNYSLDTTFEGQDTEHELTLEMYYCGMETIRIARKLINEVQQ